MGVVHDAHDNKLDQDVVREFLRRDTSFAEEERTRSICKGESLARFVFPAHCNFHPDFATIVHRPGSSGNRTSHLRRWTANNQFPFCAMELVKSHYSLAAACEHMERRE